MRNDNWLVGICAALTSAPLTAILIALILVRCDSTSGPDAPPFLGKWVDDQAGTVITLEFRADRTGTLSAYRAGELISRALIDWEWKPPILISTDRECSTGNPPVLIPCDPRPDSIRVSIAGDEWPITLERDGETVSFHFGRSN